MKHNIFCLASTATLLLTAAVSISACSRANEATSTRSASLEESQRTDAERSVLLQRFIVSTRNDSQGLRLEVQIRKLLGSPFKSSFDIAYSKRGQDGRWSPMKVAQRLFSDKEAETGFIQFEESELGPQYFQLEAGPLTSVNAEATFDFEMSAAAISEIEGRTALGGYFEAWYLVAADRP